uniref:Uncharacterized protein n=1 Tax=Glossina pallidipes TaxID=7398 RepID=A0A1A9ZP89_GLOPL
MRKVVASDGYNSELHYKILKTYLLLQSIRPPMTASEILVQLMPEPLVSEIYYSSSYVKLTLDSGIIRRQKFERFQGYCVGVQFPPYLILEKMFSNSTSQWHKSSLGSKYSSAEENDC